MKTYNTLDDNLQRKLFSSSRWSIGKSPWFVKAWFEALLRLIYFSFTFTLRGWSLPVGYGPYGFLIESMGCYSRFLDLLGAWTPGSLPSTVCLIEFQLNSWIFQLLYLLTSWSLILYVHSLKDGQWLEENL